jgi:hypothetical protein
MPMIDIFKTSAFDAIQLTNAVVNVPNKFGKLRELGLFGEQGVTTRTVSVEYDNRSLKLLASKPVGSPGDMNKSGKRNLKSFTVPHYPFDDVLLAEDIQNKRQFGSEDQLGDAQYLINKKLMEMRESHDQTLEWMRLGVLKGIVQDGAGSTILNIYSDFGLTQTAVGFALPTAGTDVRGKCNAVKRAIELALLGETMTTIISLCSPTFYDALTGHAKVEAAFANWNAAQNLYSDYRKLGFTYNGITFIEYNGSVPDPTGTPQKMIADDEAYFFPMGTSIFQTYFAPADFMEAVNTAGLPVYAKQEPMAFNRGLKIHTQSNPLPLCLKPTCVIKGTRV